MVGITFWNLFPISYFILDEQPLDKDEWVPGQAVDISKRKPQSMDNGELKHVALVINT